MKSICIATKTRTIGDALMLSSLPRKLKKLHPGLRILTYPRGFNPVVFWNNPYVDGITWFPGAIYGDDCNEGHGHIIALKDAFFGIPPENPKPEIYLTSAELKWGENFTRSIGSPDRRSLPLLLIHPFGRTITEVLTSELWLRFVKSCRERYRIVQLGIQGQTHVEGCDAYFLAPKNRGAARRLFALIRFADRLIGIDSGPMHVARAFGISTLVVTNGEPPEEIFERRRKSPYFLTRNWTASNAFLYEDLRYLHIPRLNENQIIGAMNEYLSS